MTFRRKQRKSLDRRCGNGNQVVVFIHGILEGPKQFRTLAKLAKEEGYSTYSFCLPGHGGSSGCFAKTDYMSWVQYTSRKIAYLSKKYDEMIIVGHSMGALIAICEAAHRRKGIRALFLINPPLKIHLWPRVIKSAIAISMGKVDDSKPYTQAEYHAMGVEPLKLTDSIGWLNRYSELLSMVSYTRKQIYKLNLPMNIVFASKDEFVSQKSSHYFKHYKGKISVLYLQDSGHFCYHHSDLIRLEDMYLKFIKAQKICSS